jgi:predicted AlkP superfamily pyrophosphatase or phosphodiesterase
MHFSRDAYLWPMKGRRAWRPIVSGKTWQGRKSGWLTRLLTLGWAIGLVGKGYGQHMPPRLVVGIVVDQMRADYLRRFVSPKSRGLGRLVREGIVFWNAHYTYFPTYTGPGHASIYTGATPAFHGIAANTWWERSLGKPYYCVSDTAVQPVGSPNEAGRRSPRTLLSTTITDELRYATRYQGKVIGIALKDRSAILPAGRSGNLAVWFDSESGRWISSTYYGADLPAWVEDFNARRLPDSLLKRPWTLSARFACTDDSPHEGHLSGESNPTFPHQPKTYKDLLLTPAGNLLTLALAREAIHHEKLGQDKYPDFLCISLSTPDLVGHLFGTESCEIEALYKELDAQIAEFLDYIQRRFRPGEVVVFLTADHGVAPTPEALAERGISAGRFPEKDLVAGAEDFLHQALKVPDTVRFIAAYLNQSFYFSPTLTIELRRQATNLLKEYLLRRSDIVAVYTREELTGAGSSYYPISRVQAGYFPARSGDVVVVYASGLIESEGYTKGTTHGSIWTYDTHVPLIFWWGGVRSESRYEVVPITAVAPTLAFLLGVPLPSAAFSAPLLPVIEAWKVPSTFTWEVITGP